MRMRPAPTGRKNWNIPKTQAHFKFTPDPHAKKNTDFPYIRVSVSSPSDPTHAHPFFAADLKPSLLSALSMPFHSSYVPLRMNMAHPPLPQSLHWRDDAMVGTDRWCAMDPTMKGKAGMFWSKGGLEGGRYGDGVGWPDVRPWAAGMWLRDFSLVFDVPKVLEVGSSGSSGASGRETETETDERDSKKQR